MLEAGALSILEKFSMSWRVMVDILVFLFPEGMCIVQAGITVTYFHRILNKLKTGNLAIQV